MKSGEHLSDSAAQTLAENDIVAALSQHLGVEMALKPGRIPVGGGAWVEVDARSSDGTVFVEAFARQGALKGAQIKKVGQDILKLALLQRSSDRGRCRAIIAFASAEAEQSVRGWLRQAAQEFDVELVVVEVSDELRRSIIQAQERQVMVNMAVVADDVALDSDTS